MFQNANQHDISLVSQIRKLRSWQEEQEGEEGCGEAEAGAARGAQDAGPRQIEPAEAVDARGKGQPEQLPPEAQQGHPVLPRRAQEAPAQEEGRQRGSNRSRGPVMR